jgi:hypothetical protein
MESVNSANFCLSSDSLGRAAFVSHLSRSKFEEGNKHKKPKRLLPVKKKKNATKKTQNILAICWNLL